MKRVIDENGFEYIEQSEDRSVRHSVTPVEIGARPTAKLLNGLPDGTWIMIGDRPYRRDLDAWIAGKVHPNESKRFNTVETSWIVKTHRGEKVYRLDDDRP